MLAKLLCGLAGALGISVLLVKHFWPWILYDIAYLKKVLKMNKLVQNRISKKENVIDIFEQHAKRRPEKTYFIFDDISYTYGYTEQQATRVAQAALSVGITCGDTVSMMVSNEPNFIWTHLGFQKIGAKTSLINTSVRGKPLIHMIQAAKPKLLVVGEDLVEAVSTVASSISDISVYCYGSNGPSQFHSMESLLTRASSAPIDSKIRSTIHYRDPANFVFTSGTTGLPKPAICSQRKGLVGGHVTSMGGMTADDVIYVTLPLYHSAGLLIGAGGATVLGATFVLKRKFSASVFWEDCRHHDVTVVIYIGELCRYLVAKPRKGADIAHKVRIAFGNGLRSDIWREFQQRFRIPTVVEYYASTEGSCSMINLANGVGAVGRNSPFLQKLLPVTLVEFSAEEAVPLRAENGRCIPSKHGERGLLLTPVSETFAFEGYLGPKAASDRKLVYGVNRPGDVYFNSGDILYVDKDYFVYFADRLGDTFRWKGENVSTTEVANVLTESKFILDASVYGVKIPGQEGRAGMAAILANDGRPLTESQRTSIYDLSLYSLPPYSRPRFLRVIKDGHLTVTFKQKKIQLVEEGFDINVISDPLYFLDQDGKDYIPLDQHLYLRVINGGVKV